MPCLLGVKILQSRFIREKNEVKFSYLEEMINATFKCQSIPLFFLFMFTVYRVKQSFTWQRTVPSGTFIDANKH
jgi:hypothetical protein